MYAFYLAFKCSKKNIGNSFLNFLAACCCSVCYIPYALANDCNNDNITTTSTTTAPTTAPTTNPST